MRSNSSHFNRVFRAKQGFTLVEVLLAIVILAIISGPILSAFISSTKTNNKSRSLMAATDYTQSMIEEMSQSVFDELRTRLEDNDFSNRDSNVRLNSLLMDGDNTTSIQIEGSDTFDAYITACKELDSNNKSIGYAHIIDEAGVLHYYYCFTGCECCDMSDGNYLYKYDIIMDVHPSSSYTEGDEYILYVTDVTVYNASRDRFSEAICSMTGSVFNKY